MAFESQLDPDCLGNGPKFTRMGLDLNPGVSACRTHAAPNTLTLPSNHGLVFQSPVQAAAHGPLRMSHQKLGKAPRKATMRGSCRKALTAAQMRSFQLFNFCLKLENKGN